MVTDKEKRMIKVGEKNQPIGEDHPRAKLTDDEVEDIRTKIDEGVLTQVAIFKLYEGKVSWGGFLKIVYYSRRAAPMMGTRKVTHHSKPKA